MGYKKTGLYRKREIFHMENSGRSGKLLPSKEIAMRELAASCRAQGTATGSSLQDPLPSENTGRDSGMTRTAAMGGIVYVLACVLAAEWAVPPHLLRNPLVFATPIALIVLFGIVWHFRHGETARDLGFRMDNFIPAMRILVIPMLSVFLLAIAIGGLAGTMMLQPNRLFTRLLRLSVWLPVWAFLQQYALQAIINRRAQVLWGRGTCSVLMVAVFFSVLHLPNPWLTLATFAGGVVWAYTYQRTPNLYALALSHWLMTLVIMFTLLGSAARGMKVGAGFLLR
jgi:membrane protease YdiL (CAAX protease family)